MIGLLMVAVLMVGLSAALYPGLRGWRRRRRAAWEMERAEWREWITRP
jgi:type II secretory pathway pseudopilin PulG